MTFVKRPITTTLAWSSFGAIASMACISLVYATSAGHFATPGIFTQAGDLLLGLLPMEFAFLAALIITRQPRNRIGWLLMGPALALANSGSFGVYFGSLSEPPLAPSLGFLLALWFDSWSWLLLIFPLLLTLLLFPTGRPVSRRWQWVTLLITGLFFLSFILMAFGKNIVSQTVDWVMANPLGFIPDAWTKNAAPWMIVLLSATLLPVVSMIVRYRRATAVEREQIKWLLYACVLFAVVYIMTIVVNINTEQWETPGVLYFLFPVTLMTVPGAIGIAILRYRLWDIDIIIRRTLQYTLLSGLLALVYFGGVVVLQGLVGSIRGQEDSPLVAVVTTLAVAALFSPLRRRVQDFIDRRFYRQKYDAEQALAEFAAAARRETDMAQLSERLTGTVQEALQPGQIGLWLKKEGTRK